MTSDNQSTIEQVFSQSWDAMEHFYSSDSIFGPHWQWLKPILSLIHDLRTRGYDTKFRAGQQMTTFVLSRSREHGLRNDQARLSFSLQPEGGMVVIYYEPPNPYVELHLDRVELSPEVEQLLLRLLAHSID